MPQVTKSRILQALLVAGFSLLASSFLHGTVANAYTAADINSQLVGGTSTAVAWDQTCYNTMRANRAAGQGPRTAINNGGSYAGTTWVSAAGQGSQTTVNVDYGTKTVNLQLNSIRFLCSSLVSPDGAGADYSYSDMRVVRTDNAPNDRAPNPMGGQTNWPANTDNRFRVDSASASDGGALSLAPGSVLSEGRNNSSRYWFATPLGFTYTSPSPAGLTTNQTITIYVSGRSMTQFYGNQDLCVVNGTPQAGYNYDNCPQETSAFTIAININPRFDLTPAIDASVRQGSVVSPGDTITDVHPYVTNGSGSTASPPSDWQLSRLIVPSGGTYPTGIQTSNQPPQGFYGSLMKSGSNLASGNQVFPPPPTVTDVGRGPQTIPADATGGTRICYVLSVHPFTAGSNQWRHSDPYCFVIGTKPSIQILGGDLRVGAPFNGGNALFSSVQTSLTSSSTNTYGSWVEYGIFAPSTVMGMASLSGLSGGNTSSMQTDWSKLTFANVTTDNCPLGFGCYNNANSMGTIPDVAGRFFAPGSPTTTLSPGSTSIDSLNQAAGMHVYSHSGNLTITGGRVQIGQSYVIRATGTVTITGDLNYYTPPSVLLHNLTDIPQLIIIADNIKIADTVTNIDAWLIAEGNTDGTNGVLDTCGVINGTEDDNYATKLATTMCNNQLLVNGPVMAQRLWLRRTAGDGNTPAETFNLRADAYLWAYTQAKSDGKAVTTYTKELPPLF